MNKYIFWGPLNGFEEEYKLSGQFSFSELVRKVQKEEKTIERTCYFSCGKAFTSDKKFINSMLGGQLVSTVRWGGPGTAPGCPPSGRTAAGGIPRRVPPRRECGTCCPAGRSGSLRPGRGAG